jgi:uncharacterized protein (TIGR00369 family)
MATLFDRITRMMRGEMERPPVARLLGFTIASAERGRVSVKLETDMTRHANAVGTLHGGILCDIADAAMGMSHASLLEEGETFTTIELSINYLRPVWASTLTASGEVVNPGRTISLIECTISDERGRLVAKAKSTCMTLRGEAAQGR